MLSLDQMRKIKNSQKEESSDFDSAPSNILSNPVYFDQLFQLLSLEDDSVGQKVWDLLMILPTNKEILCELQRNETPKWELILSTQSLYKLLYLLQIIESNVDTTGNSGEELTTKLNWSSWFLENGGVDYLLNIILQGELLNSQRSKSKACIGLICHIISHFTSKTVSVISSFDPKTLVDRVLEIVLRTSDDTCATDNDKVVQHTLEFFDHCCAREDILLSLVEFQNFDNWLYSVLLLCTERKIRENITKFLTDLYEKYPIVNGIALLDILFNALYSFLNRISSDCSTSDHYFELLNNVIISIRLERDLAQKYDEKLESVLSQLISTLVDHPIVEVDGTTEDTVLIGLLKVICSLVCAHNAFKNKFGDQLIDQLYHKCLFEFPTLNNPRAPVCKCKSKKSRSIAFELLYETVEHNPQNLNNLASKLLNNHLSFAQNLWQYAPSRLERSNCGYVGLRNLGATCYMNSLMQQFFMIPKFRTGFLSLPNPDTENLDDNLLFQMQKLFLNLQESQKKYYNTIGFCNSYKDNGQPINPSNQMDADEFFNMLFEKLENALKGSNRESFFRDFFGGKVCNQVISKECDHVSENFEDFYTISVAVKGKNSLSESLDLYVECDILEGDNKYECSKCSAKVDALKRCCISELPNNLIIHMRRFEFDIEEMRRMKVNDHCQFPMDLNMEPYTKEGLARKEAEKEGKMIPDFQRPFSYYQYELVGILVHHGTAESGHYYSFIKDRENTTWYQFNDKIVDYFDERDISRSCFGGYENFTEYDMSVRKHVQNFRQREDNAYMLFYQRIQQEKVPSDEITIEPISLLSPVYQSIWQENIQFFSDKYLFDSTYFTFLHNMLKAPLVSNLQYDAPLDINTPSFKCIELATRFFSQTLTHSKEKDLLGGFLDLLKEKFTHDIPACKWFITTTIVDNWAKQFLINCPVEESREAFASLISHVLKCLSPLEKNFYDEQINEADLSYYLKRDSKEFVITSSDDFEVSSERESIEGIIFIGHIPDVTPKAFSIWMIEHIVSQLKYLRHNWRNIDQYFRVFKEFVKLGHEEKKYLLDRSVISRFIDFYIGDDSPLSVHLNVNRSNIGDKFTKANVSSMIETISDLVCSAVIHIDQKQLFSETFPAFPLSSIDRQFLLSDSFYTRLLSDAMNSKSTSTLLAHVVYEDERASRSILKILNHTIFKSSENELNHYFTIITELCNINDSQKEWRTQYVLSILVKLADYCGSKFAVSTHQIVQYFAKIVHLPIVNRWMHLNLNDWLGKWLIINSYDQVRSATEELVHNMLISSEIVKDDGKIEKIYDDEKRFNMLRELLDILSLANRNCKREMFQLPIQTTNEFDIDSLVEEYSYECSPWKLIEYFRLINWCIVSKKEKELFIEYYEENFLPLLTKIDLINEDSDENKAQMMKIIDRIVEDIEFCQYLLATEASSNRLLSYYICLKQSEHDQYYNNHNLAILFRIILQCCRYNSNFLSNFIRHSNFNWNFAYIYMPIEYPLASESFFEIMKLTIDNRELRHLQIYHHLTHKDRSKYYLKNVFRSLNFILIDVEDLIYFCKEGGLDYLSQINELQAEDLDFDPDAVLVVESTLAIFSKVTEWFTDDQYEKEANEVKQSWECIHEIFSILRNFLETSLIDSILNSTYKILYHISSLDSHYLEKTIEYLHIEHDNYYCSLSDNNSGEDFIEGPRRPCIRAHLPSFSGKEIFEQHEEYYSFVTRICRLSVDKLLNDKSKTQIILELILFTTIETIPSSGIHVTLIDILETILDSNHFSMVLLRESKYLDNYVVKVLTTETQLLDLDDAYQFVSHVFPEVNFFIFVLNNYLNFNL